MKKSYYGNDNTSLIILGIMTVFIIYFIFTVFQHVGPIILLFSIIVFIYGFITKDDQIILFGIVGCGCGLILWFVGLAGVSFFEHNPTGINMLDLGNTAINTTKTWIGAFK